MGSRMGCRVVVGLGSRPVLFSAPGGRRVRWRPLRWGLLCRQLSEISWKPGERGGKIRNKLEEGKRWKDKEWGKKLKVHKKGKGEQMKNCVIVSKETFDWNA